MTYIPATNVPLVSKRTRLLEPLLDISVACVYTRIRKRKEKKKRGKGKRACVKRTLRSIIIRGTMQKIGGRQKVGASSWFLAVGQGSIAIPHSGLPGVETLDGKERKKEKKKREKRNGVTLLLSRYRSLETVCTVKKCLLGVFRVDGELINKIVTSWKVCETPFDGTIRVASSYRCIWLRHHHFLLWFDDSCGASECENTFLLLLLLLSFLSRHDPSYFVYNRTMCRKEYTFGAMRSIYFVKNYLRYNEWKNQ